MSAFDFLRNLHDNWCHFQSREGKKYGEASRSELRRWCDNGAVIINEKKTKAADQIEFPITSMILFPNHPVTLR